MEIGDIASAWVSLLEKELGPLGECEELETKWKVISSREHFQLSVKLHSLFFVR